MKLAITLCLIVFLVSSCNKQENNLDGRNGDFSIYIIDSLVDDFGAFLTLNNREFDKTGRNIFHVVYDGPRVSGMYEVTGAYYQHLGLYIGGSNFYQKDNAIFCCNLEGQLPAYLSLYYGDDVFVGLSAKISQTIFEYEEQMNCQKCIVSVQVVEDNRIEIKYFGEFESSEENSIVSMLGLAPNTNSSLSLKSIVNSGEKFSADPLIDEYLENYTSVVFMKDGSQRVQSNLIF